MNYCSDCGQTVSRKTPEGDTHARWVCDGCDTIHYQNPLVVVGCVPERDGKILLCKRAIEPRYGYWTVPAGGKDQRVPAKTVFYRPRKAVGRGRIAAGL
ncbi:MAG: hypothetical protein GWP02_02665 [Desulfobulbaceae bacterium]|nr:hypothetical protein [Desulfobulbaceae bacterium]